MLMVRQASLGERAMTTAQHWTEPTAPMAHRDTIVLDYLGALWAETQDLAPELRDELMSTVADFIAARRVGGDDDPEAVLRRLGPPEAIAAAARRGRMPPHLRLPAFAPPAPARASTTGPAEFVAIALLTGGAVVLPFFGPVAGMLLVHGSPRWSPAQKAVAWALAGAPVLLGMVLAVGAALFMGGAEALGLAYLAMISGPFIAGLSLLPELARRPSPSR
jgi:hypothetical protein